MVRNIITYPDPVLSCKAEDLEEITDNIKKLAQDMAETMYDHKGIGLAAPQVGQSCRLVTVDLSGPEHRSDLMVLVNPCIVSYHGETEREEACLSLPTFKGKVKRAEKVTVQAQDLEGKQISLDAEGLLAVCLQHEIDHLEGIVLLDHVSNLKRNMYMKKVKKWRQQRN